MGDVGAQIGSQLLSLKFSRDDESEADALGLVMAAKAGYDPRSGVSLWQKMSSGARGGAPACGRRVPRSARRDRRADKARLRHRGAGRRLTGRGFSVYGL